jgi:uncharacterized damage-inducible protein DinB
MSTVTTLGAMWVHNDWARHRLLALAEPLPDEALDRPLEMGLGSLRATLHHLWAAERVWLDRWLGDTGSRLEWDAGDVPVARLRAAFDDVARRREPLLADVGAGAGSRVVSYRTSAGEERRFPLGDLVLHVANHGAHHRAQAGNMLRRLGVEPPKLDYLYFRIESPDEPAVAFSTDDVLEYAHYGDWANRLVLDAARPLDDAALDRPFELGVGTLRKTLLHIRDAEQWWLESWGHDPAAGLRELPTETSIAACSAPGETYSFRLGDVVIQLGGHGTHHRAQALNMLRHLGAPTPALDYVRLCEQRVGQSARP